MHIIWCKNVDMKDFPISLAQLLLIIICVQMKLELDYPVPHTWYRSVTLDKVANSEAQFCDLQVTVTKPTLLLFTLKDIAEKIVCHDALLIRHPINHE